jgi:hypothetical protein
MGHPNLPKKLIVWRRHAGSPVLQSDNTQRKQTAKPFPNCRVLPVSLEPAAPEMQRLSHSLHNLQITNQSLGLL